MKKANYLFLCLIFFFSVAPGSLFAQPMRAFAKSEQRYVYDVFYKQIAVGKIIRELQRDGSVITANTTADLSFLFYHFGVNQLSYLYWDKISQLVLSKEFVLNRSGFTDENIRAYFFKSGHRTSVIRNGKTSTFTNEKEKIIDLNAIIMQIGEGLKLGQTHFDFYMQTSDSVEHYFFAVTGKEDIHSKFGKLKTYRLEQTGKDDRTLIAWFSPQMDYQMVKFHYKHNLLDLHGVLTEHSSGNLGVAARSPFWKNR